MLEECSFNFYVGPKCLKWNEASPSFHTLIFNLTANIMKSGISKSNKIFYALSVLDNIKFTMKR